MTTESMIELISQHTLWSGLGKSLYGEQHWLRTFKFADLIMKQLMKRKEAGTLDPEVIGMAALMHDIGRVHDGDDEFHGFRGVATTIRVACTIFAQPSQLTIALSPGMDIPNIYTVQQKLGRIADIVCRHSEAGPGDYLEMQVVKDANKLDRVRFGGQEHVDASRLAFPDISMGVLGGAFSIVGIDPATGEERISDVDNN
jgi:hypothetical protein